jgi:plasmid stabilization system protein ParE
VIPWNEIGKTWLVEDDFTAITQHIADLSDPAAFEKYSDLLREADLLFVDAPKDGKFEPAFLANLNRAQTKDGLLAVFDDIRTPNMLASWDQIDRPKLDLVSFGHWSGTGLVDWTK